MRPVVLSHLEFTILWESYDENSHLPYPAYVHSQASFRLLSIWNKVLVPQPLSPKSLVPAYLYWINFVRNGIHSNKAIDFFEKKRRGKQMFDFEC